MTPTQQTILPGHDLQDTAVQEDEQAAFDDPLLRRNGNNDDHVPQPGPIHSPFFYPAWPTSQPGPQATAPPPGQHPHRLRTDQMVYECYDQERGIQCVLPPVVAVAHQRARAYLPVPWLLDVEASEAKEIARWLDDGGVSSEVEVEVEKEQSR